MPGIGSLVVDLQMRMAQFQQQGAQAQKTLEGIQSTATRVVGSLKGIGAVIIGGLAVAELAQEFRRLIDVADEIGDVGAAFGLTTEQVTAFRGVAKVVGLETQDLITIFAKFSQRLREAGSGDPQAVQDLKALGVTADDIKKKNFDQILRQALAGLDRFEGGANKVAILRENFGKTGFAMDEFASKLERLTPEVAALGAQFSGKLSEDADKFKEQLSLMAINAEKLKVAILSELLPALNRLIEEFINAKREGEGFLDGFVRAVRRFALGGSDLEVANEELRKFAYQLGQVDKQIANAGTDERRQWFERQRQQLLENIETQKSYIKVLTDPSVITGSTPAGPRVAAPDRVDAGKQAAEAKALADEAIKALDREIKGEQELLQQRNEINKTLLDQNQITFEEFFRNRETIAGESTARLEAIYDEQIAILKKLSGTVPKAEQPGVRSRIGETEDRRSGVAAAAAFENTRAFFEQLKATQEYERKLVDVRASLLELTGDLERAAGIKFDLSNMELLRQAIIKSDEASISLIERLRAVTVANAQVSALQDGAARVREALANAEARVRIEQELGASSELEGLQKVSAARQRALGELQAIATKFEEIAAKSGDGRLKLQADSFKRSVEELGASADLVAQKFRQIGQSGVSQLFTDLLDGTKSVSEAFRDMGRSIQQEINKLVAQDLASRLFKSVLGGGDKGGSGGGSPLDFIGKIFSSIFSGGAPSPRAMGGPVGAGRPYIVGEQGPELFVPGASGTIVPNGGGGMVFAPNFYISGPVTRATEQQLAAAAYQGARRAAARNG